MSSQLRLSAYGALATMATALSLMSVFATSDWVVPVMGAIVIVAGSCALVRASPLPSAFEPITAAIAVLLWITLLDARSKAHFGFVPGRLGLRHLGRVARSGFTEVRRLPTPAPAHHGLVLLTVVGVAAVALVVDLVTVTLRRAALAGLPLLALFTVCAATGHHGVGIVAFVFAAVGYLWLLYADNREKVARWGAAVGTGSRARPASAWSTDASAGPAPASLGRRVGALAISFGVLIPLIIPGLHTGIDKHGTGDGSGTGGSVVTFNPIVAVGHDLSTTTAEPVISYRTSSANPAYLRMTALDLFNGTTFSSPILEAPASESASENLPVTPPAGPIVTSSISVSRLFALRWLPVAATAIGVSVGDDWRYDPATATVFSATTTTRGLTYTTRSVANDPTSAQLESAGRPDKAVADDMIVPGDISPSVRALAKRLTSHAATRYDAALDIQQYFTTGSRFTYDTNIPADNSPNALAHFLFRTKRGFCQQFATAMAVLARLAGIPSRVAVGFTRGTHEANGSWLVTTHDAHAWPELWFQGYGWLAFEPTPRADGQAVTPGYAAGKPSNGHNGGGPNPKPTQTSDPGFRDGQHPRPGIGTTGGNGSGGKTIGAPQSSGMSVRSDVIVTLALLVALAMVIPGLWRAFTRRRRWRRFDDPAMASAAAWAELRDTAVDLRAPWDDDRTPRQIVGTLATVLGSGSATTAALGRLAHNEEQSRYSARPAPPTTDLRRDVAVVRTAVRESGTGIQRTLAWAMPRSTLLVAKAGAARIADGFDWLASLGSSIRRLRPPRRWPESDRAAAAAGS